MNTTEISNRELRELREKAQSYDDDQHLTRLIGKWVTIVIVTLLFAVFASKGVSPQLNLYRANTEKKAVIAEQRAKSEAAEFAAKSSVIQAQAKADAEVIRAEGLAQSQAIISETLTEDYIRYLYIQAIEGNPNQIIYVPTEAGLPILEAGRTPTTGD